jgi:hypothetical protein
MTTLESFDFEYVWSFNHSHLNMKECLEKLCQVEVHVKKGAFQVFQGEECDNCEYALESSMQQVWKYTKAKQKKRFVPYNF